MASSAWPEHRGSGVVPPLPKFNPADTFSSSLKYIRNWPFLTKWWDLLDLSQVKKLLDLVYTHPGGVHTAMALFFFCKVSFEKHPNTVLEFHDCFVPRLYATDWVVVSHEYCQDIWRLPRLSVAILRITWRGDPEAGTATTFWKFLSQKALSSQLHA